MKISTKSRYALRKLHDAITEVVDHITLADLIADEEKKGGPL